LWLDELDPGDRSRCGLRVGRPGFARLQAELPVRGPREFTVETMHYACNWQGSLHWFEGSESIVQEGRAVFALRFSGGMLA